MKDDHNPDIQSANINDLGHVLAELRGTGETRNIVVHGRADAVQQAMRKAADENGAEYLQLDTAKATLKEIKDTFHKARESVTYVLFSSGELPQWYLTHAIWELMLQIRTTDVGPSVIAIASTQTVGDQKQWPPPSIAATMVQLRIAE